jgi:hypothetical protein
VFAAELDRRDHVGDVGALGNQTGLAIDHGVIDFSLLVVTRIRWFDQITTKLTLEFSHILLLHWFLHLRQIRMTVLRRWRGFFGRANRPGSRTLAARIV